MICFDDLHIEEALVRAGKNPPDVVTACRSVNIGLFLSGDLRRDVEVIISSGGPSDITVISFPGRTLKRVSPDERSISFFLWKAITKARELHRGGRGILPNGILFQRTDINSLIEQWKPEAIYMSETADTKTLDLRGTRHHGLFIVAQGDLGLSRSLLLKSAVGLPNSVSPERFVLEINLNADNANDAVV
jgi:tRNA pseudouridine-54 N-methylase